MSGEVSPGRAPQGPGGTGEFLAPALSYRQPGASPASVEDEPHLPKSPRRPRMRLSSLYVQVHAYAHPVQHFQTPSRTRNPRKRGRQGGTASRLSTLVRKLAAHPGRRRPRPSWNCRWQRWADSGAGGVCSEPGPTASFIGSPPWRASSRELGAGSLELGGSVRFLCAPTRPAAPGDPCSTLPRALGAPPSLASCTVWF